MKPVNEFSHSQSAFNDLENPQTRLINIGKSYPDPQMEKDKIMFPTNLYVPVPYSSPKTREEGRRLIRDTRIPSACYKNIPCVYCGQPSI